MSSRILNCSFDIDFSIHFSKVNIEMKHEVQVIILQLFWFAKVDLLDEYILCLLLEENSIVCIVDGNLTK